MTRIVSRKLARRFRKQQRKDPQVKQLVERYGQGDVSRLFERYSETIDLESVKRGTLDANGTDLTLTLEGQRDLATQVAVSLTHSPAGVAFKSVTTTDSLDSQRVSTMVNNFQTDGEPSSSLLHSISKTQERATANLGYMMFKDRGAGQAKQVMGSLLNEWDAQEVESVGITSVSVGSYAWLKYGFAPRPASWEKLSEAVKERADTLNLPSNTEQKIEQLANSSDPKTAWQLADLTEPVETENGPQKLGKALLVGLSWMGSLDLKDQASRDRLQNYLD